MTFAVAQRGIGHADYGQAAYGYEPIGQEWLPILVLPDGSISTNSTTIIDEGISTGGTATTIDDTAKNWEVNMLEGALVRVEIAGVTYSRRINSNTLNQIVFDTLGIVVPVGTRYMVKSESQGENRFAWASGHKLVAAAGTAVVLGSQAIPADFKVVIGALNTNAGVVYIGNSKANAEDHTIAVPLLAGQAAIMKIVNTNLVWVDADFNNEGVFYFAEV